MYYADLELDELPAPAAAVADLFERKFDEDA
jgi:hypothetical protein